ncbi:carbohydrate-binding domain-containing protein [Propionimicrobium sp. PCR01-08-3]|uniref:carbohydrate-binding domain-containing protein n=1 Tax=Propionimicrobium sp. PCR01-08-3 TaxID=3052086 RepID=UPI00255C2A3A|nr:carbohydrate-binding domain-containing protein [Propionimicrobium sp. PCR01-08-3]WIY81746.1 carbohydrate-binding domain-containing protein [Propionimicrobium sp. PCR01-08-3]
MKHPKIVTSIVALAVAGATLAGCSSSDASLTGAGSGAGTSAEDVGSNTEYTKYADVLADNVESHADSNDGDYDASEATTITLADEDVSITEPGTYILSGTLTDHSVTINSTAQGKVKLVLDNVTMTSSVTSPIIVTEADEAVIILAEGSTNTITDTSTHSDAETDSDAPDAAIFSMADLTIGGSGSLAVSATQADIDGIASKGGLVILAGNITVDATDDGIRGKDYLIVEGGTLNVAADQDGLKSTNEDDDTVGYVYVSGGSVTVNAGDDGAHAEGDLLVSGGELTIASSYEGLEGANIVLAGGTSNVTSSDDGLNATQSTADESAQTGDDTGAQDGGAMPQGGPDAPSGMPSDGGPMSPPDGGAAPSGMPSDMPTDAGGGAGGGGMGGGMNEASDGSELIIAGGELTVNAEGDGIDSNGTVTMNGGTVVVHGPTNDGNGALDTTSFGISGGSLTAAGSSGMAVAPTTDSEQGWVMVSQSLSAGQTIEILDGDTVLASYTAEKDVQNVVFSQEGMTSGTSYTVQVDGSDAGTVTADEESAGTGGAMPGQDMPGQDMGGNQTPGQMGPR